jgi:hypothetical protein
LSNELLQDRDLVLLAVRQNGNALRYAENFHADKQVVMEACANTPAALVCVHKNLHADADIQALMLKHGYALRFAPSHLRRKSAFVVDQVRKQGLALEFAGIGCRNDKSIVLEAVSQDGYALQYASAQLRADLDVVKAACDNNAYAVRYASSALCHDKDLMQGVFKRCPDLLDWLHTSLCEEDMAEYVAQCSTIKVLQLIPVELHTKRVVCAAIATSPNAITDVSANVADSVTELAQHFVKCCTEAMCADDYVASCALACQSRCLCLQIMYLWYLSKLHLT